METRFLGRSGLEVTVLSFGTMTFGGSGFFAPIGKVEVDEARRQVDICLEAGVNLFDTADIYSWGQSEEILGQALGARRKDVLIATKAFARMGERAGDIGLSRQHLIEACEASLRRLGTDWIDLYQAHNFDALVPLDETLRAFDDLITSGKVRYIGCSNYAGWQLMKAAWTADRAETERYISQQIEYSLMVRDAENELLPAGVDQGIGSLIWSPLAQGYLSGKFGAATTGETRLAATGSLAKYDTEQGRAVVAALKEIAAAHEGASPAQVALNWLLRRPGVTTLIIGARTEAQLRDNLAAATWKLSDAEVEMLDRASQPPLVYPNYHHRRYGIDRNPQLFPHY